MALNEASAGKRYNREMYVGELTLKEYQPNPCADTVIGDVRSHPWL